VEGARERGALPCCHRVKKIDTTSVGTTCDATVVDQSRSIVWAREQAPVPGPSRKRGTGACGKGGWTERPGAVNPAVRPEVGTGAEDAGTCRHCEVGGPEGVDKARQLHPREAQSGETVAPCPQECPGKRMECGQGSSSV